MHSVKFHPSEKSVSIRSGASLLEAARKAGIEMSTDCGGEGLCGKCKMIVLKGDIPDRVSWPFSDTQFKKGWVLACLSHIYGDLTVEIPGRTRVKSSSPATKDLGEESNLIDN